MKKIYRTLARAAKKEKIEDVKTHKILTLKPVPEFQEPEDKIATHVTVTDSGCWFWKGSKDKYGYGQIRVSGKLVRTHRFAYEVYYGPFDKSLHVCHTCDQPSCVNPDHLFLGSAKDNAADRATKGRNGFNSKRCSEQQKADILERLNSGKSRREVAEEFAVHERTIGRISVANQKRLPNTD